MALLLKYKGSVALDKLGVQRERAITTITRMSIELGIRKISKIVQWTF